MIILENKFVPASPETMPSERVMRADLERLKRVPSTIPAMPATAPAADAPPGTKVTRAHRSKLVPVHLPVPSVGEMASNFGKSMLNWIRAGVPVVTEEKFRERLTICRGCPFWDEDARLGLGKCNSPGCGCTKAKHWIATEKCPQGKW